MVDALIMVVVVVSMVAIGTLVWNRVNAQERGDSDLERRLRADDERAEDGRRRRAGLPPLDRQRGEDSTNSDAD